MASFLIRLGFVVVTFCVGLILVAGLGWFDYDQLSDVIRLGIAVGIGAVLIGGVLSVLGRAGGIIGRKRCVRCRKPVRKGAIYCPDHLQEAMREARDKYHHEHGSGM